MSDYTIQIEGITPEIINQVVLIHQAEIAQGFLSSLGKKALAMIFEVAANGRSGILLVAFAKEDPKPCGFLLGTVDTGAFYREFMVRKGVTAVFQLLPKLLSIDKIRKVLETLFYPAKQDVQVFPAAELLDIAILADHQGTGLAQALFQQFVQILAQRSFTEFKITTGERLFRAQRFYERLGAEKAAEIEVHKGQKTLVYVYSIPKAEKTIP